MNETLQAIRDYVQSPGTDYALLITGPWGCGKTFFWRNTAAPDLKTLQSSNRPEHVLYVSLYGVSDVKDISRQLFVQRYSAPNQKGIACVSRLAADVLTAFGIADLKKIDLQSIALAKNTLICFDDLERTNLPMTEALGYINHCVEHEGVKAIILCNEDAIVGDDERKTYERMREKLVGASLTYRPDINTVIETLINDHASRNVFHEFIAEHTDLVKQLFEKSETHNIRVLRRAIAALAYICDILHKERIDLNALTKHLIYVVAPAAFELHGRNANPAWLRIIFAREYLTTSGFLNTSSNRKKTEEEQYEAAFARRYLFNSSLSEWGIAVGCPPILEFLLTGVLDRPALLSWAQKLTKEHDEKEKRHQKFFFDPTRLEDEEFEQTVEEFFSDLDAGQISDLGRFVGRYNIVDGLANNSLIPMSCEQVCDRFIAGLRKAVESGTIVTTSYSGDVSDYLPHFSQKEGQRFLQEVHRANTDALRRERNKRIATLLSTRGSDPTEFVIFLGSGGDYGFVDIPVFQEMDAGEVARWILTLSNDQKHRFRGSIKSRYRRNDFLTADSAIELPTLRKIQQELRTHCVTSRVADQPIAISNFIVQQIVVEIGYAISKLEGLKQEGDTRKPGIRKDQGGVGQENCEEDAVMREGFA